MINRAPPTREQAIHAACLVTEGAVASHLTAGGLWRLQLPEFAGIHVTTVAGPRIRRAGIVHHRRSSMAVADLFDIDLAYSPELVGLEFDGWDTHGTFSAFDRDRERTRLLVALGWTLLPVTARTRPADLVRDVRAALALCGRLCSAWGHSA